MTGLNSTPPYFTNRLRELAVLAQIADDLLAGRPHHVALFGLRRIGKTLVCQEQLRRLQAGGQVTPVYLDLEDLVSSPELFAQRYVGLSCFWAVAGGQGPVDPYLNAIDLLQTDAGNLAVAARTATALINQMSKQKTDYSTLLTIAFEFPERLAEALGRPCVVFLDEFPELLTLGSFPGVGDPLKLFRAVLQRQTQVAYVITGSAVSATEHIVRDHESPLFLQFRALELHPFTPEDTQALAEKLAGRLSPAAHAAIYTYTFGHPFYITALADRVRELAAGDSETVTADLVSQAFVLETLENRGQIYGYCQYLYDISLQKARGYGVLKALLQILAIEDGLTLSEIAGRVRRQASAARDYLRRLMAVDLLVERDGRYFYADPVFRYWVAQTTKGVAIDGFPRQDAAQGPGSGPDRAVCASFNAIGASQRKRGSRVAAQAGRPDRARRVSGPGRLDPSASLHAHRTFSHAGWTGGDRRSRGEREIVGSRGQVASEARGPQRVGAFPRRSNRPRSTRLLAAGASMVHLASRLHPRRINLRRREWRPDK